MSAETVSAIEGEVRDLIKERGVDPLRDQAAVRVLIDEAFRSWEERALVGDVEPVSDRGAAVKSVMDSVAGFGPLQRYLDDPEVEEIWINGPAEVYVAGVESRN